MLGQGSTGGLFHTSTSSPVVTVGPDTPTEIHFDFCQGGEMWSEDNCGFNLWGFVDLNDFVVDRFRANGQVPYNRIFLRPKTPFG